jgi:chemotaxis protein CheD
MKAGAIPFSPALSRPDTFHITQGQYRVSGNEAVRICTLLGSCVAACIRDPIARVGGMNHFLLPEGAAGSTSLSYGVNAMELLINDLLRRGARRDKLEAKLFGGGRILRGVSDVGAKNAEFAQRFLADEGIAYIGGSLGGLSARKIEYWPHSGRVRQQLLERAEDVFEAEVAAPAPAAEADGGLELF